MDQRIKRTTINILACAFVAALWAQANAQEQSFKGETGRSLADSRASCFPNPV
jgi:hypothetical protein